MKKIIYVFIFICLVTIVQGANDWQQDFNNCPDNYAAQDCLVEGELVCGYDDPTLECSDPSEINAPSATEMNNAGDTYQSELDGGFIIDCLDHDGTDPYCSNGNGDIYWCNRNDTCYDSPVYRQTNCTGGQWAKSVCGNCRSGRYNCYGDTNCESTATSACDDGANNNYDESTCEVEHGSPSATCECNSGYGDCDEGGAGSGDGCEVQFGVTNYPSGANNHYDDCDTCGCDSGWEDCDASGCDAGTGCNYQVNLACATDATNTSGCTGCSCDTGYSDCDSDIAEGLGGNGCEIEDFVTSCTVGGTSGQYDDSCTCVVPKVLFYTGNLTEYYTSASETFLWFYDWGLGNRFVANGTNNKSIIINETGDLFIQNLPSCSQCLETDANGWVYCGTDATGGGGNQWNITTSQYLGNYSNIIDLNETPLNFTIIQIAFNGSFYYKSEVDNSTIVRNWNTSWITDNQNNLYNTSQQIWDNVINGTLTIDDELDNSTIVRSWNTSWITDNQNNAYNTTPEIRDAINESGISYNISVPCSLITQDAGEADTDFCVDTSGGGTAYWDTIGEYMYPNETRGGKRNIDVDFINASSYIKKIGEPMNSTPELDARYCFGNGTNCVVVDNTTIEDFGNDTFLRLDTKNDPLTDDLDMDTNKIFFGNSYIVDDSGDLKFYTSFDLITFSNANVFHSQVDIRKDTTSAFQVRHEDLSFLFKVDSINNRSIFVGDFNVTKNMTASYYCNATECHTISDFLIDTTGGGGNQWNITTSQYLGNYSNVLDLNETPLNLTINRSVDKRVTVSFSEALGFNITTDLISFFNSLYPTKLNILDNITSANESINIFINAQDFYSGSQTNESIIQIAFNGSFYYKSEVDNSTIVRSWNTSWITDNQNNLYNTSQQIWDNVINSTLIIDSDFDNSTIVRSWNTSWIIDNQNNLYNTSQQIWDNVVYNGTFPTKSNLDDNVSKKIENKTDVNISNSYANNQTIYDCLFVNNSCVNDWSQINLSNGGDTSMFLKNKTDINVRIINATNATFHGDIYMVNRSRIIFLNDSGNHSIRAVEEGPYTRLEFYASKYIWQLIDGRAEFIVAGHGLQIGSGKPNIDYFFSFFGQSNAGAIYWKEDEDYFYFWDDILMKTSENLYFRDTDISINSPKDGYLNISADGGIGLTAPDVTVHGNLNMTNNNITDIYCLFLNNSCVYGWWQINATGGGDTSLFIKNKTDINVSRVIIDSGITSAYPLDIVGSTNDGPTMRFSNNVDDSTNKIGGFAFRHYTNAEEDVSGLGFSSLASSSNAFWGGGTSLNAVTAHYLYTAPTTTTVGGTIRLIIDKYGNFDFRYGNVTMGGDRVLINGTLNMTEDNLTDVGGIFLNDTFVDDWSQIGGGDTSMFIKNKTDAELGKVIITDHLNVTKINSSTSILIEVFGFRIIVNSSELRHEYNSTNFYSLNPFGHLGQFNDRKMILNTTDTWVGYNSTVFTSKNKYRTRIQHNENAHIINDTGNFFR